MAKKWVLGLAFYILALLFVSLMLAWLIIQPVYAATPIPAKERIADVANVLSSSDKNQLTALSAQIEAENGAVLVAVIVPKLQDETIEEYTERLHDTWKPGQADGRGAIMVISIADRKIRIAPTRALGTTYTDARAAQVIEAMKPYMRKMEYSNAISTYLMNSAAFAGKAEPSSVANSTPDESLGFAYTYFPWVAGLICSITLIIYAASIFRTRAREKARETQRRILQEQERQAALERAARMEAKARNNQRLLDEAPERPGYDKLLLDGKVIYMANAATSHRNRIRDQEERNAQIRRNVAVEKAAAVSGFVAGASVASTSAHYEAEERRKREREEEAIRKRRESEERERKTRDEAAARRRRERDDSSWSASSFSSSWSSSSSSSSDSSFSSSSSSSSDGGGSSGDY